MIILAALIFIAQTVSPEVAQHVREGMNAQKEGRRAEAAAEMPGIALLAQGYAKESIP